MNREIKFRAWDSKNKKFPFGEFNIIGEVTVFNLIHQYSIEAFNDLFVVQFTGLKDKNDKEIYEGDILECPMPPKEITGFDSDDNEHSYDWFERGIVKYYDEYASFGLEFYSPEGGEGFTGLDSHITRFVSDRDDGGWWVIGNIFENSDLICKNFVYIDWQSYSEKSLIKES